uniref:Uncharacterized protein n=1 Tax=Cacopsylla melanoneura TaxID=428564 RepID=A0A8D8M5H9_9HEMI
MLANHDVHHYKTRNSANLIIPKHTNFSTSFIIRGIKTHNKIINPVYKLLYLFNQLSANPTHSHFTHFSNFSCVRFFIQRRHTLSLSSIECNLLVNFVSCC